MHFFTRLYELSTLLQRVMDRVCAAQGLTLAQYRVLSWLRQEGGMPCGQLANRLMMARQQVQRVLEQMQREGWVEKQETWCRVRRVDWVLTPEGAECVTRVLVALWPYEKALERAPGFVADRLCANMETALNGLLVRRNPEARDSRLYRVLREQTSSVDPDADG